MEKSGSVYKVDFKTRQWHVMEDNTPEITTWEHIVHENKVFCGTKVDEKYKSCLKLSRPEKTTLKKIKKLVA